MKKILIGCCMAAAATLPLSALAEDAQGQWTGTIANTLNVIVTISKSPEGVWAGTLAAPSQALNAKVEKLITTSDHLSFSLPRFNATFEAKWDDKEQAWVGTWTQGANAPLSLKRATAQMLEALKPKRPQELAIAAAAAGAPYDSVDLSFNNAKANIALAATLTLPKGKGPFPAVVLVHGSGPLNRDEEVFDHKVFLVLADHLSRQGIAVLRYDKRGNGKSGGDYKAATTFDFAGDAEAALACLRGRADIDPRRIGILGHSEGGIIAPMVAARDPALAFVVMLAGPGVSGAVLMPEQFALMARTGGDTEQHIAKEKLLNQALFTALTTEPDLAKAKLKAKAILGPAEQDGVLPPGEADRRVTRYTSPWFMSFLAYEPAPALRQLKQAILVLNGELDLQVPVEMNLTPIRAALAGNPKAVVTALPGMNHLFQTAKTGAGSEYGNIEETMAPRALALIGDWIAGQVKK